MKRSDTALMFPRDVPAIGPVWMSFPDRMLDFVIDAHKDVDRLESLEMKLRNEADVQGDHICGCIDCRADREREK